MGGEDRGTHGGRGDILVAGQPKSAITGTGVTLDTQVRWGSTEPRVIPTEPLKCLAPAPPTHRGTRDNKVDPDEVPGA